MNEHAITMGSVLAIGKVLNKKRFDLSNEKDLQADIEQHLKVSNIPYQREVHLSETDIIDFMVDGVGIEIKLKGTAKNIHRQCERYCGHEEVKALMLVTNKAMNLPRLNNKFTYVLNLGKAWL